MRRSGIVVVSGAVAAVIVTCVAGTPRALPDVALGSAILLHVELLAGYVVVLVLITKAWSGQLPTEMSTQGFRYEIASDTVDEIAELHAEIATLRLRVEAVEDAA
jgi:hypothetical protein